MLFPKSASNQHNTANESSGREREGKVKDMEIRFYFTLCEIIVGSAASVKTSSMGKIIADSEAEVFN